MDRVRLVLDGSNDNGEIMDRAEAEKRIAALLGCQVADLVTEPLVDGSGDSYYASEEAHKADDGSIGPVPRIDDLGDANIYTIEYCNKFYGCYVAPQAAAVFEQLIKTACPTEVIDPWGRVAASWGNVVDAEAADDFRDDVEDEAWEW